jgi:predicted O-methyltransferase YrrM
MSKSPVAFWLRQIMSRHITAFKLARFSGHAKIRENLWVNYRDLHLSAKTAHMRPLKNPNRLPSTLKEIISTERVVAPDGREIALHSNISAKEAEILYDCVYRLRPTLSLEIGLAFGISGLAILQALEDLGSGFHIACDPLQSDWLDIGVENVKRSHLEHRFRLERRYPEEVIPTIPPIQFAFVDGSHLFDFSVLEFVLIDKKLQTGGVIGFHDLWMPSIQKLLRYILSNREYEISPLTFRQPAADLFPMDILRRACALLPHATTVFAPEFLKPWFHLGLPNLVFLNKVGEDKRRFPFHVPF